MEREMGWTVRRILLYFDGADVHLTDPRHLGYEHRG
jgi:hypothetical protein